MYIFKYLPEAYVRWRKKTYKRNWEDDFRIFLKKSVYDDPFNLAGLELALLHLKKTRAVEPSTHTRRLLKVYASTVTIDQLLSLLTYAKRLIDAHDYMPSDFFPNEECRLHRFDDYFVSADGHVVSIEKIVLSLEGRLTQLVTNLETLEVNDGARYDYYNRKLYPLFRDIYFVLQAIHATRCH